MIKNKQDLKEYISLDNSWIVSKNSSHKKIDLLFNRYARYPSYYLKKYLKLLRKQEYYCNTANNPIKSFLSLYYERRKNKLGIILGNEIGPNIFGKGLSVFHGGNVINPNTKAGENCTLHGNVCIGNNGITKKTPVLGNNVDIGFGAVIIGDIFIADNVKIGANSVVTKSIYEEGSIIAGVPAKVLK